MHLLEALVPAEVPDPEVLLLAPVRVQAAKHADAVAVGEQRHVGPHHLCSGRVPGCLTTCLGLSAWWHSVRHQGAPPEQRQLMSVLVASNKPSAGRPGWAAVIVKWGVAAEPGCATAKAVHHHWDLCCPRAVALAALICSDQQRSRTVQLVLPTCVKAARPADIADFPLPGNSLGL